MMRFVSLAVSVLPLFAGAADVVLPPDAGPSTRYAAEEYRRFTKGLASDVQTLRLVETTKYGEEGFRLRSADGRTVEVAGGVRGVLYGVYEILERFGDIDFLDKDFTYIPKNGRLRVPKGLDEIGRPAFALRGAAGSDAVADPDYAARVRVTGQWFKLAERHGGNARVFGADLEMHTIYRLFPVKEYPVEKYPDCYARNRLAEEEECDYQPCYSSPFVISVVTSNALACIRKGPKGLFYSIGKKDGAKNYCRCPRCVAIDKEEGSHAGTIVRFVNAVAEGVEKEFPEARLTTLCYTWSRHPTKKTKFRHNVVPYYCTYEADYSDTLEPAKSARNREIAEEMRGWAAMSDAMFLYDYPSGIYNYLAAFPTLHTLQPNMKFYQSCKVKYFALSGCGGREAGEFHSLRGWIIAKLMWNPDRTLESLLDRYLPRYYGAAAPYVREYIDFVHSLERDHEKQPMRLYTSGEWNPESTDENLARTMELWRKAEDAVRDDPVRRPILRREAMTAYYQKFAYMALATSKRPRTKDPAVAAAETNEIRALARELLTRMREQPRAVRLAESPTRNSTLTQAVFDWADVPLDYENLKWRWAASTGGRPYRFEISEDSEFPAERTQKWTKLEEPKLTIPELKPATVYHWRGFDGMGRPDNGHFRTKEVR